jgi:hypothetical protein
VTSSCEYGDELSGSGVTELVSQQKKVTKEIKRGRKVMKHKM